MNIGADMGVDVGTRLHVVIRTHPGADGRTRALFVGEVQQFPELDELLALHDVRRCVIDAQPETRAAREFAGRFKARVRLAYYDRERGDHEWEHADASGIKVVHVNRTLVLEHDV